MSLVRLSSVTHAFNMNQRINVLAFQVAGWALEVTAPASPNVCPPGHYMLFILNRQGVPSVARMVRVKPPAAAAAAPAVEAATAAAVAAPPPLDAIGWRSAVRQAATGTPVLVGITGTCPYGIGACWGGANEALRSLEGVHSVDPIPDVDDSTATLFLKDDRLPPLDRWGPQFERMVNGSYVLRGVEVTLQGTIETRDGQLFLDGGRTMPPVQLAPADPADTVQWDRATGAPRPLEPAESEAYGMLAADARTLPPGQRLTVTGPLKQTADGYRLEVRLFTV